MRAIKLYSRIEDDHTLSVRLPDDKIALHCARLPVQDSRQSPDDEGLRDLDLFMERAVAVFAGMLDQQLGESAG